MRLNFGLTAQPGDFGLEQFNLFQQIQQLRVLLNRHLQLTEARIDRIRLLLQRLDLAGKLGGIAEQLRTHGGCAQRERTHENQTITQHQAITRRHTPHRCDGFRHRPLHCQPRCAAFPRRS